MTRPDPGTGTDGSKSDVAETHGKTPATHDDGAPSSARPTVTVGGLPGTGTSTLCRLLHRELGVEYVYAGQLFRDEAQRRGLDLASFGRLCQEDPSVDKQLDARQEELLRRGGLVLEGRLAGLIAHTAGIPAVKVWLVCDHEERIRRIVEREGGSLEEQARKTQEREASEADRYRRYYGFDLSDTSSYDLVLDSTRTPPQALLDQVLARLPRR